MSRRCQRSNVSGVTIVATLRSTCPAQPVRPRAQLPPVVIGQAQAPPTQLPPQHPILFDQVRQYLPLLAVQPADNTQEQHAESRDVDHGQELTSGVYDDVGRDMGHFYEAALSSYLVGRSSTGLYRQTSSERVQPSHPAKEGWARERVTRRQPRRQASFLTSPVARWFTLLCALWTAQYGRAHEKNPTEESRSLRDGSQERPPVPTR